MSELPPDMADGEDLTAGEYALGVLDQAERAAAVTRMQREPAFAREVEAWEARLYPMADAVAEALPPPHVWPRIQRAIGGADTKVVQLSQRRAVVFWRNWAMAATAAAAVALVFLMVRQPAPLPTAPTAAPPPAILIASLNDKAGRGFMTASYNQSLGELRLTPNLALPLPSDRAAELWLIPADGTPRSLGVIDGAHPSAVKIPEGLRQGAKTSAVLAITSEQPGGSPNGKPTTKPLWVGHLTEA